LPSALFGRRSAPSQAFFSRSFAQQIAFIGMVATFKKQFSIFKSMTWQNNCAILAPCSDAGTGLVAIASPHQHPNQTSS
jgi:hypothetical protein